MGKDGWERREVSREGEREGEKKGREGWMGKEGGK